MTSDVRTYLQYTLDVSFVCATPAGSCQRQVPRSKPQIAHACAHVYCILYDVLNCMNSTGRCQLFTVGRELHAMLNERSFGIPRPVPPSPPRRFHCTAIRETHVAMVRTDPTSAPHDERPWCNGQHGNQSGEPWYTRAPHHRHTCTHRPYIALAAARI